MEVPVVQAEENGQRLIPFMVSRELVKRLNYERNQLVKSYSLII
jgi:hypothetical protein